MALKKIKVLAGEDLFGLFKNAGPLMFICTGAGTDKEKLMEAALHGSTLICHDGLWLVVRIQPLNGGRNGVK